MKTLLLILLFITVCFSMDGQWGPCQNWITFDPPDSLNRFVITIDTTDYHHNIWQVGAPHKAMFTSAHSLPNAIITDTLHPYPVNDTSVFILKIPGHFGGVFDYLQFIYKLDIDSGAVVKVEWSVDSSNHWVNLVDSLPSPFVWNGLRDSLSSSTTGWTYYSIDQGGCGWCPVSFDTILFRFSFISDSVPTIKDGWMIDDIVVMFYCEGYVRQIQNKYSTILYPNPATSTITISSSFKINSVAITNLLGLTVFANQYNAEKVKVDVLDLPTGVYFIKINGTEVRKFVKE